MFKNNKIMDETIYGTINECRKLFHTNGLIKLFESTTLDVDFNPINAVDFNDYCGNKIAYFNDVKGYINKRRQQMKTSMLFESVGTFENELEDEINSLLQINELSKLQTLNPLILKTKIFTKQPINVMGFDIRRFNQILSQNNIVKCFSVMYCMTMHKIYFILPEKFVYIYDVYSGKITKEHVDELFDITNYVSIINNNFTNNVIELETEIDIKSFIENNHVDNLFNDGAIRYLKSQSITNYQRSKIIR